MARRKQTRGKCGFCGREMTSGGLTKHLKSCDQRQALIEKENQGPDKTQKLYHLQVRDAGWGGFWLHLEMKGSAALADLDHYLRGIWLECCGHMSMFSVGGWGGDEIPLGETIEQVFEPGLELTHIYDFGTSSHTLIKMVELRTAKPLNQHPIYLMARNQAPELQCIECEKPAGWLCMECMYEDGSPGTLCDEHAQEHPHDEYGDPLPIVNSPRTGMCGYGGPADPPY